MRTVRRGRGPHADCPLPGVAIVGFDSPEEGTLAAMAKSPLVADSLDEIEHPWFEVDVVVSSLPVYGVPDDMPTLIGAPSSMTKRSWSAP